MDCAEDGEGGHGKGGVDVYLALEDEHFERMIKGQRLHRFAAPNPHSSEQ